MSIIHRERAYYLYCLTPPGSVLDLNQAGVFVEDPGRIRAVLSEVRREEFSGEAAEERLQDLAWLAPRAALHEAVVEQVMGQVPVLPAPFATLFESRESVRRFVLDYSGPIAGFFRDLGNKREWAVKGLLHRAPTTDEGVQQSTGKNYLHHKRNQAASRETRRQKLRDACEQAAAELKQQADAFHERKVWKGAQADGQPELIFNWAFLLPPEEEAAFREKVASLDEQHRALGLSLVISGPWPPYSFAPSLGPR